MLRYIQFVFHWCWLIICRLPQNQIKVCFNIFTHHVLIEISPVDANGGRTYLFVSQLLRTPIIPTGPVPLPSPGYPNGGKGQTSGDLHLEVNSYNPFKPFNHFFNPTRFKIRVAAPSMCLNPEENYIVQLRFDKKHIEIRNFVPNIGCPSSINAFQMGAVTNS